MQQSSVAPLLVITRQDVVMRILFTGKMIMTAPPIRHDWLQHKESCYTVALHYEQQLRLYSLFLNCHLWVPELFFLSQLYFSISISAHGCQLRWAWKCLLFFLYLHLVQLSVYVFFSCGNNVKKKPKYEWKTFLFQTSGTDTIFFFSHTCM